MFNPDDALSTPEFIERVRDALGYERGNEQVIAEGHEWAPRNFLPAAKVAYERILAVLSKPVLAKADLDAVHAEMLGVFEQPNYSGVQLFFSCEATDRWLATMDSERPCRPSLADYYRTYVHQRAEERIRAERLRNPQK